MEEVLFLQNVSEQEKTKLIFRIRVLRMMLSQGIPLHKLEQDGKPSELRTILEEGNVELLSPQCMGELVADLSLIEAADLINDLDRAKLQNNGVLFYSLIFDGTTRFAECFGIIIRFFLDGKVTHRLLSFDMLKRCAT